MVLKNREGEKVDVREEELFEVERMLFCLPALLIIINRICKARGSTLTSLCNKLFFSGGKRPSFLRVIENFVYDALG